MNKSESITELAKALCKAQSVMGGASKGADNPFFKSKYADLSAVVQAIKEPFSDNGLSYIQFPIEDNGRIGIETTLMHDSGEWMTNSFTVQLDKQNAQGAGSAISYCRRYGLQAIAGIPSEDDDGNSASAPVKKITAGQVKEIQTLLLKAEYGEDAMCADVRINSLNELSGERFKNAVGYLTNMIESKGQG
jgi:hypothetical protein